MLTVPVYLTGGFVCKINGGEGEHLNRRISEREVRKLHVAYWTQEKGAKKEKALWMHYSAMLGHSNQRLLSACIYCVNNDRTLTFSTDAVCLSVPLHPVSSCKCSVYTVSREDTVWLEMFRWGISPPLNLIRFQALFYVIDQITSYYIWFLWRWPLPCHSSCVFVLTDPFICVHCRFCSGFFFWLLLEDGQMCGSPPCSMIHLLVMIFGRVPLEMTAGFCMTCFFYHRTHAGFIVNVSKWDAQVEVGTMLE